MKIGILTHPQHINYGGILQCYALSTFLNNLGHEVVVIRRERNSLPKWKQFAHLLVDLLLFRKFRHKNSINKAANMTHFSETFLNRTEAITSFNSMNQLCSKYDLDVVIVGSDQVWRADYSLNYGYNYFLDFVPNGVKKIAYAASFGLSEWKYTKDQTNHIKKLLKSFQGISVREKEGILLCKDYLGLDVQLMADPTLLLTSTDYERFISPKLVNNKYVFVYWLGEKKLWNLQLLNINPTVIMLFM